MNLAIRWVRSCNLVSMTRIKQTPPPKIAKTPRKAARVREGGYWLLQDAKARFSELVRRVRSEGPQHVTVHGRDEVVVLSAEEFRRLKELQTGAALIEAIQASPYRDLMKSTAARLCRARCPSMKGWLLDTNVISELRRPHRNRKSWRLLQTTPLDIAFRQFGHSRGDSLRHRTRRRRREAS